MKKIVLLFLMLLSGFSFVFGQPGFDGNTGAGVNPPNFSTAFGSNNTSTGQYSFVGGSNSVASASHSFAFGEYVQSSADYAYVLGKGVNTFSRLQNNTPNSFMIGFNSRVPSFFIESFTPIGGGFVGIHTTAPRSILDVAGELTVDNFVMPTGAQVGYVLTTDADGNASWAAAPSGGSGGDESPWTISGNHIWTMLSGNVGIGTDTPAERLHVFGNLLVESGAMKMTNLDNKLIFGNESSSTFHISRQVGSKDGGGGGGTTSQQDIITIDANDRVGIGTNNPEAELHVHGKILAKNEIGFSAAEEAEITFGAAAEERNLQIVSLYNNGQDKGAIRGIVIDADGNLGVGTNNPEAELHVDGTTKTSNFIMTNNPEAGKILVCDDNNGNAKWQFAEDINGLGIWEESNEIAYYDGSVGIGISAIPTAYKLAVNGAIGSKKVVVTLDDIDWPDFVFSPDYQLPKLSEIESYVKEHKHLPNVPTAQEVKENGLDLGEMNSILLQKIEELTLLMIEQQKGMNKQQEMMSKQQEEINLLKKQAKQ